MTLTEKELDDSIEDKAVETAKVIDQYSPAERVGVAEAGGDGAVAAEAEDAPDMEVAVAGAGGDGSGAAEACKKTQRVVLIKVFVGLK